MRILGSSGRRGRRICRMRVENEVGWREGWEGREMREMLGHSGLWREGGTNLLAEAQVREA
jgi:hypothetical protein